MGLVASRVVSPQLGELAVGRAHAHAGGARCWRGLDGNNGLAGKEVGCRP